MYNRYMKQEINTAVQEKVDIKNITSKQELDDIVKELRKAGDKELLFNKTKK